MKRALIVAAVLLGACWGDSGTGPSRYVADVVSDITPPAITAFSLSSTSITTSDADVQVSADFTVAEDGPGATFVRVIFVNPSGNNFYILGQTFVDATTNLTGSLMVDFPQYSETGNWTVHDVMLQDASGNRSDFYTEELVAMGFPTTVSVFSLVQDVTPPTLTALDLWPKTISTANGPSTVDLNYVLTDDVSGAWLIYGLFCPPTGTSATPQYAQGGFAPTLSAAGSLQFTFPQLSVEGTWTLCLLRVRDATKNDRSYSSSELEALGFPASVGVVNALTVPIDVRPGSSLNAIKLGKQGKVPVAILSSVTFDAPSSVARTSLTFGRIGNETSRASCAKGAEDVNGDGYADLVCHFYTPRTGFQMGDEEGVLRGMTLDQIPIEGRDAVRILR